MLSPCTTIDQVVDRLEAITRESRQSKNPLGYFAALYLGVTRRVQQGLKQGEFSRPEQMEKLDVVFANRYFEALELFKQGKPCSKSWYETFRASTTQRLTVLQHLVMGMNAHIHFDLGLAAVETVRMNPLETVREDFFTINTILAGMIETVELRMSKISPLIQLLLPLAGKADEMLTRFSITTARDLAWTFASEVASAPKPGDRIGKQDEEVALISKRVGNPQGRLRWITRLLALTEWRGTDKNIAILEA
ncbi:MAG TPA: DUF5995 family protein [Chitinophagaceae bacterium]|nr:DUF5995 family protein [Chitinophagaceae bacterium]HNF71257.1 DUF5995 family protein [Chitinophagaceae bacterium]